MKKARNFWRDLPQGGSRYGSVLTRLFLLLCLLATTQAGWATDETVTATRFQISSGIVQAMDLSSYHYLDQIQFTSDGTISVSNNQLQIVKDETITIAASGKTIKQIVIIFNNAAEDYISLESGGSIAWTNSKKTATWTGSATSVQLKNNHSSNTFRFTSVAITYTEDDVPFSSVSSVDLTSITRIHSNSGRGVFSATKSETTPGVGITGYLSSDNQLSNSSGKNSMTVYSPRAISSIELTWKDSEKPELSSSPGGFASTTQTWTAADNTTKEVTFTNGTNSSTKALQKVSITFVGGSSGPTAPTSSVADNSSLEKNTANAITLTSSSNTVYYKWSQTNNEYAANAGSTLAGVADGYGSSTINVNTPSTAGTWYLYTVAYDGTSEYSDVTKYTYTITNPTAATPTFSPASGSVTIGNNITISSADGGTVYWQWDSNSDLTTTGTTGTTVSTTGLSAGSHTLYAVVTDVTGKDDSAVGSATYTLTAPATPLTAVGAGTFFDFSNWTTGTVTSTKQYATDGTDGSPKTIELVATTDNGVEVATNSSQTIDDASFTKRLKLNGTGNSSYRYIHFKVSGPCTIYAYAFSDNSSRKLKICTGSFSGTDLLGGNGTCTTATKLSANYTGAGEEDIFIYSNNKNISVYGIKIESTATQYTINKDAATNGSFETKVSGATVTTAAEGATVTVTTTPTNSGWVTNTVTVRKTDGEESVTCTGSGNNYTFTMPGEAVTVTATFKMATPSRTVVSGSGTSIGTNEYNYAESLQIKLTKPSSATKMYYTTDGTDPTNSGTRVVVTASEVTLDAFTAATTVLKYYATDDTNNSDVMTITYHNTSAGKVDPTLTWSDASVTATMGVAFTTPTLTTDPATLAVTYSSSDTNVATVNESTGAVTLVGAGTATISANSAEQTISSTIYKAASAGYTLTVNNQAVTLAWATPGAKSMTISDTYTNAATATATATSAVPESGTITYSSSNSSIASVSSAGVVTAVAPGTATITASYAANGIYNAATPITYEVTVRAAASGKVWDFTADESTDYAAATTYWAPDKNSGTTYYKSKFTVSSAPYEANYTPSSQTPDIEMLDGLTFKRDGSSMSAGNYRWFIPAGDNDGYLRFGGQGYGIVLKGLTAGKTYTIDYVGSDGFNITNAVTTEDAGLSSFKSSTRTEQEFKVSADGDVFISAKASGSIIYKITEGASTTVTVAAPTITPDTDETFAASPKTVTFACATDGATVKYVVGTTQETDAGTIKAGSTGGNNTSVDVSDGVAGQCNLWISAVAVKTEGGVDYTSDPVYLELTYAGVRTAKLSKTDIQMQSGNYKAIDVTITDNDGNPILFGEEDVSNVDYTTYYDFEYELTASTSALITLEDIEGHTVVNSRVDDSKAPAGSTATVRVTATPKAGSGIDSYVANPNATLTADVNVTITEETTGISWVDLYWDEACTIPITTTHQNYTGPAKDKNMVFDNFPNGKTIYLKMNTEQVDTICFYYNNYDQTKPSANVSKTSGRKIITKNSTNSKLARSASYLYRHAIPIYMHEELTGDPAGKKVWVTLAGYKGTSTAVYGNIINMEFTLAANGLKSESAGTRPDAPTYKPTTATTSSDTKTKMTTTQSSIAVGEPTGTVMAKYSTDDSYNIIYLVNMDSEDNPRTLNVGKGSVGVFSTKKSLSGTTRKTTGVQFVDGVVSDISNAYYLYYPAQKEVTMSFEPAETTVHIDNTAAFTKPTLNITPAEGEEHIRPLVTYSYTESATGAGRITSIASDGTITWASNPQPGVVTVKASFAGDEYNVDPSYARAEATYQIYVIDPNKEVIYIKPGSCDFYNEMDVTLEGANNWTGYYTTTESDTEPEFNTTTWTRLDAKQTAMIHLRNTTNVWAYVVNPDNSQNEHGTHQKFTLKTVAKPTLYPDGVTSTYYFHGSSLEVTASTSVAEASVYYVVDGDKDDLANGGGTRYEGRITLDDTKMHTIYAVTQDKDGHRSEIVTGTYMKASTLEQPWFNINNEPGGDFASGQTKEINTSAKIYLVDKTGDTRAEIYYTVDGSSPTTSSTKYTSAFHINKSGTVVKAISVLLGDVSPISTATFTFAASSENRFWEANSSTCDSNGKLKINGGKSGAVINTTTDPTNGVADITATFGSIYQDSKDDWKHVSIGEESKGDPIDGVGTYQIATGYNPQDENGALYTHMNSSSSLKVHERTFKLPARGAYVRFEPEKDGDLTIWALQNGGVYYTDATEGQENFLSGFIRKRPVYMIDEQGICQAATDIKAAGKLSDNWNNINRDNLLGKNESSPSGVKQELYEKAEAQAIYDMYDAKIGEASTDNIQDMLIYLNDGSHEQAANAGIGTDTETGTEIGVCIPSASYMRYTFKVRAGKTYFFFAQRTKLGIRGFRFDPDENAEPENVTLDDTGANEIISTKCNTTTDNVTVTNRTFAANTWTALLLPFSISATQVEKTFGVNTRVIHFEKYENYKLYWRNHHYDMIVAGTPVLIYPTQAATIEGLKVQIESTEANDPTGDSKYKFNGTYGQGTLNQWDIFVANTGVTKQWTGSNNKPYKSLRAWITGFTGTAQARSTIIGIDGNEEDDVTTGIYEIPFEGTDAGDTFAKGNNNVYSVSGMLIRKNATSLEGLPAGVYIINGKKVVIND